MNPKLIDATAAAARLGLSVAWIKRLAQQGRIPAVKVGNTWVFLESDIGKFKPRPRGRPRKVTD